LFQPMHLVLFLLGGILLIVLLLIVILLKIKRPCSATITPVHGDNYTCAI